MPEFFYAIDWRIGLRTVAFSVAFIPAQIGIVAAIAYVGWSQSLSSSIWIGVSTTWFLAVTICVVEVIRPRVGAGAVLLDLGPVQPKLLRWCGFIAAPGICITAINGSFTDYFNWTPYPVLFGAVVGIGTAAFFLSMPIIRLQIRKGGIRHPGGLIRWKELEYHVSDDGSEARLFLRHKKTGLVPMDRLIRCPLDQREAVEDLLSRYCPIGESAPT